MCFDSFEKFEQRFWILMVVGTCFPIALPIMLILTLANVYRFRYVKNFFFKLVYLTIIVCLMAYVAGLVLTIIGIVNLIENDICCSFISIGITMYVVSIIGGVSLCWMLIDCGVTVNPYYELHTP